MQSKVDQYPLHIDRAEVGDGLPVQSDLRGEALADFQQTVIETLKIFPLAVDNFRRAGCAVGHQRHKVVSGGVAVNGDGLSGKQGNCVPVLTGIIIFKLTGNGNEAIKELKNLRDNIWKLIPDLS